MVVTVSIHIKGWQFVKHIVLILLFLWRLSHMAVFAIVDDISGSRWSFGIGIGVIVGFRAKA